MKDQWEMQGKKLARKLGYIFIPEIGPVKYMDMFTDISNLKIIGKDETELNPDILDLPREIVDYFGIRANLNLN